MLKLLRRKLAPFSRESAHKRVYIRRKKTSAQNFSRNYFLALLQVQAGALCEVLHLQSEKYYQEQLEKSGMDVNKLGRRRKRRRKEGIEGRVRLPAQVANMSALLGEVGLLYLSSCVHIDCREVRGHCQYLLPLANQ